MAPAHLGKGLDREVESLLRIVTIGEKHVGPADRVAVDGHAAREPRLDRQWEARRGDVTSRGAVDRVPLVGMANDVADVVAVDQQLICLLDRAAVGPGDKTGRAHDHRGEQAGSRGGGPTLLEGGVWWGVEVGWLGQVGDIQDVPLAV